MNTYFNNQITIIKTKQDILLKSEKINLIDQHLKKDAGKDTINFSFKYSVPQFYKTQYSKHSEVNSKKAWLLGNVPTKRNYIKFNRLSFKHKFFIFMERHLRNNNFKRYEIKIKDNTAFNSALIKKLIVEFISLHFFNAKRRKKLRKNILFQENRLKKRNMINNF